MSRKGTVTPRVERMVALADEGYGFNEIGRRLGVSRQAVMKAVRRLRPAAAAARRPEKLGPPPTETDADLDRIEAEQRRCLPKWWAREVKEQRRGLLEYGRAAEPVRITSRRVWRKGTR